MIMEVISIISNNKELGESATTHDMMIGTYLRKGYTIEDSPAESE